MISACVPSSHWPLVIIVAVQQMVLNGVKREPVGLDCVENGTQANIERDLHWPKAAEGFEMSLEGGYVCNRASERICQVLVACNRTLDMWSSCLEMVTKMNRENGNASGERKWHQSALLKRTTTEGVPGGYERRNSRRPPTAKQKSSYQESQNLQKL